MADLPLQPTNQDIYSYGFDRNLNRELDGKSSPTVYDTIQNALNTGSILSGGNLNLKTLSIGGLVKQVAPGDDIQAAIDAVNREGGGTVQLLAKTYTVTSDINLKSNIVLAGSGRDLTILEFNGSAIGVKLTGTSSSVFKNVLIQNLTIQNSNNTAGLDIDFCDFWKIENVRVTSCDQIGIRINRSQNYLLDNVRADNNTGNGFSWIGTNTRNNQNFLISVCTADTNGGIGFSLNTTASASLIRGFTFQNCFSTSNTGDGFDFASGIAFSNSDGDLVGCNATSNVIGFDVATNISGLVITSNIAETNSSTGFKIAGNGIRLIGNVSNSNTTLDYDITTASKNIVFLGNELKPAGTASSTSVYSETDQKIFSSANIAGSTKTEKRVLRMKNTSGGDLAAGDVVVMAATANGDDITTTTTGGDDKVFGMSLEAITSNEYGLILVEGYTQLLKVDGTTDIAIGDFLSTFTTAKIAKKASAGDMCFAMALEAYTTDDSNGVINALVFSPRLI